MRHGVSAPPCRTKVRVNLSAGRGCAGATMFLFTWVVPPAIVERAHVDAVAAPGAGVRVGAEHVAGDLAEVLLGLAPHQLGDASPRDPIGRPCIAPEIARRTRASAARPRGTAERAPGASPGPRAAPTSDASAERAGWILPRSPRCRLATPPRSYASVVIATRQPSCSGPSSASTGTRTSVKKISLNSCSPVIVTSGRTSTPGQRHVDEQARDAAVLRRLGIGAHQQLAPVGEVAERVPGLLPVDDEVVAVEHGRGTAATRGPSRRRARRSPGTRCRRRAACGGGTAPSARRCRTR